LIRKPAPGDERRPAILVSDAGPLSLLATVPGALDWLFVPGCEVWIHDIILDEVLRNPGEGKDQRVEHRAEVAGWVRRNRYRIKRLETRIGKRYAAEMRSHENAMELWRRAGSPPDLEPLRPEWKDRGDRSAWVGVNIANDALATGEAVLALADDHNVRAAIEAGGRQKKKASINLMGTQTFIQWMAGNFAVEAALTAWDAIETAREGKVPTFNHGSDDQEDGADDPIYIRVP
jgi:hypothetical protein